MKILIVPDVHGRPFWRKAKEEINNVDKVVFLGDYLDPYPYEGITEEQALEEFKEIIQFKKENPNKVVLLIGNHCTPYIWITRGYHCRHDYKREEEIHKLYCDNKDLFKTAFLLDGFLFSHAGVYKEWLDEINLKLDDFLYSDISFWDSRHWCLDYVSRNRGGRDSVSSCTWADISDMYDNHLLDKDSYYHIFGHTQLQSGPIIFNLEKWACLDVRRCFILDTITNNIEPL